MTFNNRKALVTGASRGIGKAIATQLADAGVHVICVSKSDSCKKVADELTAAGKSAEALQIDVSDKAAIAKACEDVLAKHECIDILVNNAGITRDGLLIRMSDDDWNDVIDTNLSSAFYFTKGLLRPMTQKRWGRIVNISSVSGVIGTPGQFNYSAAKAGLIGATKSLAKECAARNITANVVAPGFIETDMTANMNEKAREAAIPMIPLKRMGSPDDIANTVKFISSEEANYITGQVFTVDGGLAM